MKECDDKPPTGQQGKELSLYHNAVVALSCLLSPTKNTHNLWLCACVCIHANRKIIQLLEIKRLISQIKVKNEVGLLQAKWLDCFPSFCVRCQAKQKATKHQFPKLVVVKTLCHFVYFSFFLSFFLFTRPFFFNISTLSSSSPLIFLRIIPSFSQLPLLNFSSFFFLSFFLSLLSFLLLSFLFQHLYSLFSFTLNPSLDYSFFFQLPLLNLSFFLSLTFIICLFFFFFFPFFFLFILLSSSSSSSCFSIFSCHLQINLFL